ncbi:LLM class flavin-dependent oxidoreductase [Aquihabitans sp. G128]|uniref:LLM class flavin-dependent oxidoreductase n=1 Tax=Aquihabitans sp. G128 TaxID=2849779 RepID=UPI001C23411E|nr:LLM class flavin-dependent oxidoreductase [Aquihabitans sp. G128]QXC59434.1 LLM class flavin-dependent oxidoreductase [Aquihabitans sp. G128]
MRLSVLDLSIVGEGATASDALASSLRLARAAERLGYHRYWVAEHHNMPGIASSSPPVLIAHLAAGTTTLRLGSGGVMLPNHSPLVVAEQFGMLEALHPGRIDLGLGRAPGTDGVTAAALRRTNRLDQGDDFPNLLGELLGYFNDSLPPEHPFSKIHATPARGYQPAIWLLGSSDYSAHLAGRLGIPFSFAHHFAGDNTEAAAEVYRRAFTPSDVLDEPYLMLGVNVLAAPTEEEARFLSGPSALSMARLRQGRPGLYPTPEAAAAHEWSPQEVAIAKSWGKNHVIGTPGLVRRSLEDLVARTGADELMVTTMAHGPDDRIRSLELTAEVMDLAPAHA